MDQNAVDVGRPAVAYIIITSSSFKPLRLSLEQQLHLPPPLITLWCFSPENIVVRVSPGVMEWAIRTPPGPSGKEKIPQVTQTLTKNQLNATTLNPHF